MEPFFSRLGKSYYPGNYKNFADEEPVDSMSFVLKATTIFFIVMILLLIPQAVELPKTIQQEFEKVDATFDGNVSMTGPILLPKKQPIVILDTTGEHKTIGKENLLVTDEIIEYRIFGKPTAVEVEKLKSLETGSVKSLAILLALIIVPAAIFWTGFVMFLKYLTLSLGLALTIWVVLDLTRWKQPFRHVFSTTTHALVAMIPLELIFMPINTEWMVKAFSIFYVPIYLVPLVLYLALTAAAIIVVITKHKHHDTPL